MTPDAWRARWERGETGWHLPEVHPALKAYKGAWRRVLVPLCGASLDLDWLAERGVDVVGVELSDLACRRVFERSGQAPETREVEGASASYTERRAGRLRLLTGDMLAVDASLIGPVDAVWDRGCTVALAPRLRDAYLSTLSRVARGAEVLLVTIDYDQRMMDGPPFAISDAFVRQRFDAVELLDEAAESGSLRDRLAAKAGLPQGADPPALLERVYRARVGAPPADCTTSSA